jgi:transglutaminase-like putative cysteine protease
MAVAPHAARVPAWVTAVFAGLAAWRLARLAGRASLPGPLVRLGLGLGLTLGVYLSHGGLFGPTSGVTLLVGFAGLKLIETETGRDVFVGVLLACFLTVASVLFVQSIPVGVYLVACVVAAVAALVSLSAPPGALPPRRPLSLAAALVLQATPFALVLFLLFPRLPGPLWGVPTDSHAATSGLDETMSPGHIARLGLSDEVAFRVKIESGEVPAAADLYWRGPVLWATDGQTWQAGEPGGRGPPPSVEAEGPPVRYTVTLEPHGRRWLFLLDAPTDIPPRAVLRADYQVLAATPVRGRQRYDATSATRYRLPGISERQRLEALQLPRGHHARAVALATAWRDSGLSAEGLVARALAYFREGPFVYTLSPPLLQEDPVDEFLFGSRRGFCEHYAAAFAVLMRAAGVPARVVTGYQGGTVNPIDGYLVVRQRDAHAWAEVFLDGRGWVRVDPTAAVSPDRVERGLEATLADASPFARFVLEEGSTLLRWLRGARDGWDAVNNWWNQWVLGFETRRQREVLGRFGIDPGDWRQLGSSLLVLVGVPLLALIALLHWRHVRRHDPARRAYDRFCRRLARVGLARSPTEPPLAYAERAATALPDSAAAIRAVTEAYTRARYGRGDGDLPRLRELVRRFRPASRAAAPGQTNPQLFG